MSNVKFRYLYRDASNYKSWADVIFSNAQCLSLEALEKALRERLLPDGLFIARQIRLPELFLFREYPITQDDHCFHEFNSIEVTGEPATDEFGRSTAELLSEIGKEGQEGWRTFDPLDAWSLSTAAPSFPCRA